MARLVLALSGFLALILFLPSTSMGHAMELSCSMEGELVECESKYDTGHPVRDGHWRVLDATSGEEILSGVMDAEGGFSFLIPRDAKERQADLKVATDDGMGHRATWKLEADYYLSEIE